MNQTFSEKSVPLKTHYLVGLIFPENLNLIGQAVLEKLRPARKKSVFRENARKREKF